MNLPPLTHTFLANFENCPRKAYHVNIAKDLPREPQTEAMRWGNEVHSALEHAVNARKALPETMAPLQHFVDTLRPLTVQAEIKVAIDPNGLPVDFFAKNPEPFARGKVDVLALQPDNHSIGVVIDWKTGKKREDSAELELHAMMLKAARPALKKIIGHYVWLKDNEMGRAHDLSNTALTLASLQDKADEMSHQLKMGYMPPRQNPLCGWCPVKKCEFNTNK